MMITVTRRIGLPFFALSVALMALPPGTARAEISEVRISQQYGLTFLPLIVARNQHFIEKHAAAAGLTDLKNDMDPPRRRRSYK